MSPERTWIRAPLFWARALFTVLIDLLSWALSYPVLMARIEGYGRHASLKPSFNSPIRFAMFLCGFQHPKFRILKHI
jgi:hypothetical protein